MRYYDEFMRACKMTVAIVFTMALIKVGIPFLLGKTMLGSPTALFLGLVCTTLVCLTLFTAMNILDAKLRDKKGTASGQGDRDAPSGRGET